MNTQAVFNVYINCFDDLSLYELKNNVQLNLNASHKKTFLSSESIFASQSLRLTSLVFDVVLSNEALDVRMHLIDYEWCVSARLAREIRSKRLTSE